MPASKLPPSARPSAPNWRWRSSWCGGRSQWLGCSGKALWGIDRASDWNEFRDALRSWVGPQQNIVYGDGTGTIGFIAPGRVPIRKQGNAWLPVPGWKVAAVVGDGSAGAPSHTGMWVDFGPAASRVPPRKP